MSSSHFFTNPEFLFVIVFVSRNKPERVFNLQVRYVQRIGNFQNHENFLVMLDFFWNILGFLGGFYWEFIWIFWGVFFGNFGGFLWEYGRNRFVCQDVVSMEKEEGQEFRGAKGKLIAIENSLFDKINSYIVIL